MNVTRIAILGVAAIAAGAAALLVRGMLGGGTAASQASLPPPAITSDVLVAAKDIAPGHALSVDLVRWEAWPKSAVSSTLITKEAQPDIGKAVEGAVVRAPLVSGQPITDASIVRAGSAGFLAATIKPGMRAIGVPVTAETSAGGFILPNDRVDVVLTRDVSGNSSLKLFVSGTILRDVRVLAIDQTSHQEKDQQSVVGKTATLELTPSQAELLTRAQQSGILSLALRALGDSEGEPVVGDDQSRRTAVAAASSDKSGVTVFRFGVLRSNPAGTDSPGGASGGGGGGGSGAGSTPAAVNPITVTTTPSPGGVVQ
jgi:pilus assembly protein CpaB